MRILLAREMIMVYACAGVLAGCSRGTETVGTDVAAATLPVGGPLPGIDPDEFEDTKAAFNSIEGLTDGLGPIFNERACGLCHTLGGTGGAGEQVERRFGRFVNGQFDPLENRGGSLRQLFTVGSFTAL